MKILFDYQAFYNQKRGGISRSLFLFLEEVKKRDNLKINLISFFSYNSYITNKSLVLNIVYNNFHKLSRYLNIKGRLISRYWVNFRLSYFPPDIFIPTYYDSYFINSIGITPFVVTIHDMIHELYYLDDVFSKKIVDQKKKLILKSKAIIAISNNTKKDILSIYPTIPEDKISVIYWGNPMEKLRGFNFGLLKKKQLLFVGNRDGYKNFIWFINAVSEWLKINDFILLCVGGDTFSKEELREIYFLKIEHLIIQKNLSDRDLGAAYSESFALVVPSLFEGFCFPIVEAMSLKCPVVYANNSCLPEIASNAGVCYSQNDKNDLIVCLNHLLNNNNFYNSQIELGILQSSKYTWSKCANDTVKVYEKCLI